jgi:acylphosphatase
MQTVHLLVTGKVQGVFYRATAKKMAESMGIAGWVKNTANGNVEILAQGNEEDVKAYIHWCKQGPPKAVVTNLAVTERDDVAMEGFEILR